MTRVLMNEVYDRVYKSRLDEIRVSASEGHEVLRYSFKDFSKDMRKDDLITTTATIRAKWDAAIADEVIVQMGNDEYHNGWLVMATLEERLHIPKAKRVCVCVCVSKEVSA